MSEERKKRIVHFAFDDRSRKSRETLEMLGELFDDVAVRNPTTGEEQVLVIPRPQKGGGHE